MPTKELEVGNIFIVDPNTGERTELKGIPTLTMATNETLDYEPILGWDKANSNDFSATIEIKNMGALRDLLYKSLTVSGTIEEIVREVFVNMPLGHKVVDLDFKQNRTHKKKRINKKWARKYGYTCKVYYIEGD